MTPGPCGLPGRGIRPGGPRVPPRRTPGIPGSHLRRGPCGRRRGPWQSLFRLPRGLGPCLCPDTRPWVLLGAGPCVLLSALT